VKLLVVIPCLNEEAHLPRLLDWLQADPITGNARIVVADGGSTDRSTEIVNARAAIDPRVILLHNPKRLQSAGVNLAFDKYGGDADLLVRIDAHTDYPADFLFRLIAAQRQTNADSVTVSMQAVASRGACFQKAAATAQNSVLGTGASPHRKGGARRWVDHGHHALFTASVFRRVGGYDETFSHNEDAEFDVRLTRQGGKILLAADILIDYHPRKSIGALARQYFKYGDGRARTVQEHRTPLKPRQLIPVLVAPAIALALMTPISLLFAVPASFWLGLCISFGVFLGMRERNLCAALSGFAAAIMHAAWSAGFLWRSVRR
jgi:succinoglycan biosynthesis protein ExoA